MLPPATAQGAVELHDGDGLPLLRVHEVEFRGGKTRVRGQNLEISSSTALISQPRERRGILRRRNKFFLLLAVHALFVQRNQRIGNVAKSGGDGLLVVKNHLLLGFARKLELTAKLAALKDRLRECTD